MQIANCNALAAPTLCPFSPSRNDALAHGRSTSFSTADVPSTSAPGFLLSTSTCLNWELCPGTVLLLQRIPALLILYKLIPQIRNWKEALFTGHFGPMGVGAVFVSTLALYMLPTPEYPLQAQEDLLALTLQPTVTFAVWGSIIIRVSFLFSFIHWHIWVPKTAYMKSHTN